MKFTRILVAVATLMTLASCSDDKQPWENIPSTPITGNDATITVNGDRSYGVVTVKSQSNDKAVVSLSNILPGYPEVEVTVELKEQSDDVFSLSGSKSLYTPPMMFPLSKGSDIQPISTLSLKGTVTTSGKADIAVTTLLTSSAQGHITGKWMPENHLPILSEAIAHAPVVVDVVIKDQPEKSSELSAVASLLGGVAFYTTIGSVDFQECGSVIVDYAPVLDIALALREAIDEQNGIYKAIHNFDKSIPGNLLFWYSRSSMLRLSPNILGISYKIDEDAGRNPNLNDGAVTEKIQALLASIASMGVDTDKLLTMFSTLNSTGLPFITKTVDNSLSISITKEMIDPFAELLSPALPTLDRQLTDFLSDPANAAIAEIVTTKIFAKLGISSLTELAQLWDSGIETFTITVNLTR